MRSLAHTHVRASVVFGSRGWDAGRGDDCYPVEQAAASAPAQRQAIRHKVKNPAAPVKREGPPAYP
jgi:hypothetical protein